MMKIPHSPHHWIPVTLVVAAGLLALSEAHGQQQGAAAMFDGRPAMAGAQAGTGAMAGVPQGGLGQQGTDGAMASISRGAVITPRREVDVAPKKDNSLAREERSAAKKTKKAAKRVINRKQGILPIEGTSG